MNSRPLWLHSHQKVASDVDIKRFQVIDLANILRYWKRTHSGTHPARALILPEKNYSLFIHSGNKAVARPLVDKSSALCINDDADLKFATWVAQTVSSVNGQKWYPVESILESAWKGTTSTLMTEEYFTLLIHKASNNQIMCIGIPTARTGIYIKRPSISFRKHIVAQTDLICLQKTPEE